MVDSSSPGSCSAEPGLLSFLRHPKAATLAGFDSLKMKNGHVRGERGHRIQTHTRDAYRTRSNPMTVGAKPRFRRAKSVSKPVHHR
jgi:hypothetical protein